MKDCPILSAILCGSVWSLCGIERLIAIRFLVYLEFIAFGCANLLVPSAARSCQGYVCTNFYFEYSSSRIMPLHQCKFISLTIYSPLPPGVPPIQPRYLLPPSSLNHPPPAPLLAHLSSPGPSPELHPTACPERSSKHSHEHPRRRKGIGTFPSLAHHSIHSVLGTTN